MGIKTRAEYLDSLSRLKPNIYAAGEKIDQVVGNKYLRTSLNHMGLGYDWANDPETEPVFTHWSPLINEKVSFWTHVRQSPEELKQLAQTIKTYSGKHFCVMCMGIGLSVLWATTYDLDQAKGTEYHQRLREFFKKLQKEDLRFTLGVMDPKGDRSLPPSRQADPDLHLHVVGRNKDGIIVRGAKMHTTSAPCGHYVFVAPGRALSEADRDYAVAFAVPTDAPGLTFITRPAAGPLEPKEIESPVSSQIGFVECLSVFEDVFIPWDHVFMCGEWDFTEKHIQYFSPYVRLAKGTCVSARTDILIGAAALIAEYNGVAKAGHIRSKLNEMMIAGEIGWSCALASIAQAKMHPSGLPIPDISSSNAGLYHNRLKFIEFMGWLLEMAGGVVTTMPIATDYLNPQTRGYMDKYLKAKADVPTEHRYRLLNLIQEITASRFTGYLMSSVLCAGGTPETNRVEVFRNYDLKEKIDRIKNICGIV